jgi:hypothetical protein
MVKVTFTGGIKVLPVVPVERFDFLGSEHKLLISEAAADQVLAHRTVLTLYSKGKRNHHDS